MGERLSSVKGPCVSLCRCVSVCLSLAVVVDPYTTSGQIELLFCYVSKWSNSVFWNPRPPQKSFIFWVPYVPYCLTWPLHTWRARFPAVPPRRWGSRAPWCTRRGPGSPRPWLQPCRSRYCRCRLAAGRRRTQSRWKQSKKPRSARLNPRERRGAEWRTPSLRSRWGYRKRRVGPDGETKHRKCNCRPQISFSLSPPYRRA